LDAGFGGGTAQGGSILSKLRLPQGERIVGRKGSGGGGGKGNEKGGTEEAAGGWVIADKSGRKLGKKPFGKWGCVI